MIVGSSLWLAVVEGFRLLLCSGSLVHHLVPWPGHHGHCGHSPQPGGVWCTAILPLPQPTLWHVGDLVRLFNNFMGRYVR